MFSLLFWSLPSYYEGSEWLERMSLQTRDMFFKIRHISSHSPKEAQNIVIVAIDEESCEKLQARWPWPRTLFAQLIDRLRDRQAKLIGLNVSFSGLENGDEASTRELARAMKEEGSVVVGATFNSENHLMPPSALIAGAARFGYLEKIVDPDFSIRRSYLLRPYVRPATVSAADEEGGFESSFPLALADAFNGADGRSKFDADLGLLTIGKPRSAIYLNPDGSYVINYLAAESDFTEIPAWKVLDGKASIDALRGKAVLIGLTSSVLGDTHPTPLGILPGIDIHANELLSVLSGRVLRFTPDWATFFIAWLAGICVLLLFLFARIWVGIFAFLLAFFGLFVGAQVAFGRDIVLEPFILFLGPALAALFGLLADSAKLLMENRGLETKVIHDKLTGLYKYEYLRECLEEEWKRCKRGNLPVSIVMTDLDRFKKINDTLGHEAGNDMIRRAGEVIAGSARRYDIVSRYGGDEFVVLLWHTNLAEAQAYRTRLRDLYQAMAQKLDEPLLKDSSISIGVATYDPKIDPNYPPDPQRLVEDADKDLFTDKESRRKPGEAR